MKIRIFQINNERDANKVKFCTFKELEKMHLDVDRKIYDMVYYAQAEEDISEEFFMTNRITGSPTIMNLEDVFYVFNCRKPHDFTGHSLSVSDVVEVIELEEEAPGFYYCDEIGWKKIEWGEDE